MDDIEADATHAVNAVCFIVVERRWLIIIIIDEWKIIN